MANFLHNLARTMPPMMQSVELPDALLKSAGDSRPDGHASRPVTAPPSEGNGAATTTGPPPPKWQNPPELA